MLICVALGIGWQYVPARTMLRLRLWAMQIPAFAIGGVFAAALMIIEILGPSEPAPFIYFQF
jgi:hypothetical protein